MAMTALELASALLVGMGLGMVFRGKGGGVSSSVAPPRASAAPRPSPPASPRVDLLEDLAQGLQESWEAAESAEKGRMETELGAARMAQDMLFPQERAQVRDVEVAGFTRSFSECTGDWWHHSVIGEKLFLCVADVMGHGVAAALLTSAAKSAFSLMETSLADAPVREGMQLCRMMESMNTAIHKTSRGSMQMTFFLACVDLREHTLRYSNASHLSPVLLANDLSFHLLQNANSAHIGSKPDTRYTESEIAFRPGDRLLLYTDGAIDLTNARGKPWRLKGLLEACRALPAKSAEDLLTGVRDAAFSFCGNAPLLDDLTLVACMRRRG